MMSGAQAMQEGFCTLILMSTVEGKLAERII